MKHSISTADPGDRLGLAVARRLSQGCAELDHDIAERLRVARQQAIGRRKATQTAPAAHPVGAGPAAALQMSGGTEPDRWARLVASLPILALLFGLLAVAMVQKDSRAREVAAIDAALLTDALPTSAYTDPGFLQFLKLAGDAPPN